MAVIRCQACGKPNPDFLEECQFCDARLKPLTGILTPSPNALPPLAPMTPPALEPAPAANANIVKCQACGKPNPAFLDTCQFCDARLKPLTTEPGLPEEAPASTEWLVSTRAPAAETQPGTLPDWLRSMEPASEAPMAMPLPEPAAEVPEWMRGEPEPTPAASAEPGWMSATPAAEEDVPDWLKAMQAPAAEPTPSADWMTPAASAPPALASSVDDEVPDWLRAMQSPTAPAPTSEPPADVPDWMRASEPAPATSAEPSWMSATPEPAAADEDVPDWLKTMQAPASEPISAAPDWLSAPAPSVPSEPEPLAAEEDVPDWLKAMQAPAPEPTLSEPEPDEQSSTDWLVSRREPPPATSEVPDWLKAMGTASTPTATPEPPGIAEDVPDWMQAAEPTTQAAPVSDVPDWMSTLGGSTATAASAAEGLPDWMQGSGTPSAPTEPAPTADDGMPDWLKAMETSASTPELPAAGEAPGGEMPSWMTTMENATTQALPSVSPDMALPDDAPDWLKAMQGTGELSALQTEAAESAIPSAETGGDWLSALRGSAAELEPLPIGEAPTLGAPASERPAHPGLEEAALPSWLAAMKPIDVQAAPIDEEADAYEERVGVLAGMRGVLRAEPVVALPRKSAVQVHKLNVNADQTRQAKALADLVSADIQAHAAPKHRSALLPMVERWLVVLALLAAIALPLYGAPGLFPLPTTIGPHVLSAFNTLNALPTDKPALVVFDYDPAQSGELNASARALVKHLLLRGVTVVGLSTRPAGAVQGDAIFNEAALSLNNTFSYTYGVNYISLGYLPGGPVGVAQFAANPQAAFITDFRGEHADVWNTGALAGLGPNVTLNNFGGLILLAATPDAARAWIEQAHPQAEAVPMVAAVSAGVEPLLLPYTEGHERALAGLIAGVPGASQYEAQAGLKQETTAQSWTVIGGGLILGALPLLVVGNAIASIVGVMRRRQQRRK